MSRFSRAILWFGLSVGLAGCGSEDASGTALPSDSSTSTDTGSASETTSDAPFETADDTGVAEDTSGDSAADIGDAAAEVSVDATPDDGDAGDAMDAAEAASDALDDGDAAEVEVDAGPPVVCTSATINDVSFGTSKEVRQGYGPVQLNVVGTNLAGISAANLGPIACTIILKTATTALVSCNLAHGVALGAHALALSNGLRSGSCAGALTVTRITVDADHASANDTTGLGTPFRPFRSIGRGLSVSGAGDTVYVDANGTGSYSVASTAETFVSVGTSTNPLGSFTANVPAGVIIEGDTKAGAVTRITAAKDAPYAVFKLAGSATLRNLQIDGFRFGVIGSAGTIAISNVSITNAGSDAFVFFGSANTTIGGTCDVANNVRHGLFASGTSTTAVTGCSFHNHNANAIQVGDSATVSGTTIKVYANGVDPGATGTAPGIAVVGSGTVRLTGSDVYGNYQGGIFGSGTATIDLTTTKVYNNGKRVGNTTGAPVLGGTRFDGVRMIDGKALTIVGGQIYDNAASGIGVYETTSSTLVASLNGTNIQTNYHDGLRFDCDGRLTVRNTIFEDNTGNGVQIENTPVLVDFGTSAATGGNTFRRLVPLATPGPAGNALLADFRPARLAADGVIITVRGTTFQTITPPAATRVGPYSSSSGGQLLYEIGNANNRIQFF